MSWPCAQPGIGGLWANGLIQLTPFVTKAMAPTKSRFTYDVEKDDRIVMRERAFGGKDYLDLWASDNGLEVLELERLERETAQAAKDTKAPGVEALASSESR